MSPVVTIDTAGLTGLNSHGRTQLGLADMLRMSRALTDVL